MPPGLQVTGMTDTTKRIWLVDRVYSDKGMLNLVYATTDGQRHLRKQLSEQMVMRTDVTAAIKVDADRLEPTRDDERDRYAEAASKTARTHDPDETV